MNQKKFNKKSFELLFIKSESVKNKSARTKNLRGGACLGLNLTLNILPISSGSLGTKTFKKQFFSNNLLTSHLEIKIGKYFK